MRIRITPNTKTFYAVLRWGSFIPPIFFNVLLSNYKKVYKNYREELLSVFWFLNTVRVVGYKHNTHTCPISYRRYIEVAPDPRSTHPEVFLGKGVLKICSKFTEEHPCRSAISIKLRNFIEIVPGYGCSSVNLLHIFRTPFPNTFGRLLLTPKNTIYLE